MVPGSRQGMLFFELADLGGEDDKTGGLSAISPSGWMLGTGDGRFRQMPKTAQSSSARPSAGTRGPAAADVFKLFTPSSTMRIIRFASSCDAAVNSVSITDTAISPGRCVDVVLSECGNE